MGNANHSRAQIHRDPRERIYKVIVIGDACTGKTSLLTRYAMNTWADPYPHMGVDFRIKRVQWTDDFKLKLQIWDTAGQERFRQMSQAYYRRISGALVCFDITDIDSFHSVTKWKEHIDTSVKSENRAPVPVILLANKCDLQHETMDNLIPTLDDFCGKNGFAAWFMTSSKEDINVTQTFDVLMEKMVADDHELINIPII